MFFGRPKWFISQYDVWFRNYGYSYILMQFNASMSKYKKDGIISLCWMHRLSDILLYFCQQYYEWIWFLSLWLKSVYNFVAICVLSSKYWNTDIYGFIQITLLYCAFFLSWFLKRRNIYNLFWSIHISRTW